MFDHQKANIIRLVCSDDRNDNELALLLAQSIGWDLAEEYALEEWKKIDVRIDLKKLMSDFYIGSDSDGPKIRLLFERLFCQNPENWQYLRKIRISREDFIPEIFELEGLESLDICISADEPELMASWSGNLAKIGQLKKLKRLTLLMNSLALLPPEIGQLAQLESLELHLRELTELPLELWHCQNLRKLDIAYCKVAALPPEIGQLTQLKELNIEGNPIHILPDTMANLHQLEMIRFKDTYITQLFAGHEAIPNLRIDGDLLKFDEIPQLSPQQDNKYLKIFHRGKLPKFISRLRSVHYFTYIHGLLERLPDEFFDISGISKLNIACNKLREISPLIANFSELEDLQLFNNQIDSLPEELSDLSNLCSLNLQTNRLKNLPQDIGLMPKLRTLSLDRNLFTEFPQSICQIQSLDALYFTHNQLTELPKQIAQLERLQTLDLQSNPFNCFSPELLTLPALRHLKLRKCGICYLPQDFGQLTSLESLNLDHNNITQIPDAIASLKNLKTLRIKGNPIREEEVAKFRQLLPNCKIC